MTRVGTGRSSRGDLARLGVVKKAMAALGLLLVLQSCAPTSPPAVATAAQCPAVPEGRAPKLSGAVNIDLVKRQLRDYHKTAYMDDLKNVYAVAETYVNSRLGKVTRPAVVLDIDETALSNWSAVNANDFAFFPKAARCDLASGEACGFIKWIDKAQAEPIPSAVAFFNAMKSKNVAVFFITGRRDGMRAVTIKNLEAAGFAGWTELVTRANNDTNPTARIFKTEARARIQTQGYTILANVGDQLSDLDDGRASECAFKLPNPFYFID